MQFKSNISRHIKFCKIFSDFIYLDEQSDFYKCYYCKDKIFHTKSGALVHFGKKHKQRIVEKNLTINIVKKIEKFIGSLNQCLICSGHLFQTKEEAEDHILDQHKDVMDSDEPEDLINNEEEGRHEDMGRINPSNVADAHLNNPDLEAEDLTEEEISSPNIEKYMVLETNEYNVKNLIYIHSGTAFRSPLIKEIFNEFIVFLREKFFDFPTQLPVGGIIFHGYGFQRGLIG